MVYNWQAVLSIVHMQGVIITIINTLVGSIMNIASVSTLTKGTYLVIFQNGTTGLFQNL